MDIFEVLADPNRRQVLELLAEGELRAGDLVTALPHLSQPAVSRHLRILREGNFVRVRIDGQRRVYALDPAGLAAVDAWLRRYRRFWSGRLDNLAAHLADERMTAAHLTDERITDEQNGNRQTKERSS